MLKLFHLRWAHKDRIPPRGNGQRSTYNVRQVVKDAEAVVLEIDSTAVEILCNVCGESLRAPQREALLPTLWDVVSNASQAPAGTGSLSQAGELCAILGLAQFALRAPEPWLFVRIPEARVPQPDIFALSPGGEPWYLELKGVAKLSSQVKRGVVMETCGNVVSQIGKGRGQLTGTTLVEPDEFAPDAAIHASAGVPSFAEQAGGIALSVVVLADAALLGRTDILAPERDGCPPGKRCTEVCLRAPAGVDQTSIVGLLWTETRPVPALSESRRNRVLTDTLVTLKALDLASWAGSQGGAAESLTALAGRLADPALEVTAGDRAGLLGAGLRLGRGLVDHAARRAAVDEVATTLRELASRQERRGLDRIITGLRDEAAAGGIERAGETMPLEAAFRRSEDATRTFQVVVERMDGGLELSGSMRGGTLRLAPRLTELRRWLNRELEGGLLDRATTVVTRSVLPQLGIREFESEARESHLVGVRLRGEVDQWIVGREWGWEGTGATLLERLPPEVQESFAYHSSYALREQTPWYLLDWAYGHRGELAHAAGVSRCDVKDAVKALYHRADSASQSLTAVLNVIAGLRTLFPVPRSRRRLWATLDGTIAAEW